MLLLRCNKTNECDGIIRNGKRKTQCPHYDEHENVTNITGKPYYKITCNKANYCPKGNQDALCVLVKG
ncbi:MAG: hypothetical protein A2Y09_01215 [Planctomycetes bacterium GWA2_39_15]|nr:MAG: hypothetical protein A2Y09_01215 [Planctomycetes bacterium GWA2_39_15]